MYETEEEALEAVKQDPWRLRYLPEELRTLKVCWMAFLRNKRVFPWVPQEVITEMMALEAVEDDGLNLERVPENLRTKEICAEAVNHNFNSMQFVPDSVIDREFCSMLIDRLLEYD